MMDMIDSINLLIDDLKKASEEEKKKSKRLFTPELMIVRLKGILEDGRKQSSESTGERTDEISANV